MSDFACVAKSCCDGNHGNEEGKRTVLSNELVPGVRDAFLLNVHPRQKLVSMTGTVKHLMSHPLSMIIHAIQLLECRKCSGSF